MNYPRLFSRGRIGGVTLKNRIVMAPMEKNLADPTGAVTPRYVDYCEARAAGGAALILLESMFVAAAGRNHRYQLGLHDDALVPGYRRLVEACHRHGALVGCELEFAGRETSSAITGFEPVAPSAVPCTVLTGGDVPRALAAAEIHALVRAFADAARRAVAAGFDVIELHGAHGYLLGQFLSPWTNRRDDEYGGDFERRLRFPLEVIAAVRAAVDADVPLLYRLSADEKIEGGLTVEDAVRVAPRLEAAGIDLIDVSAGIYESALWIVQPMETPAACLAPLAREIRHAVCIPVSVAGRIADPRVAERVLADGDADFVSLGRALHADPEWPAKVRDRREDEICPCVGCLTCSDLLGRNEPVLCLANTRTARERSYATRPVRSRERIVVVGAGPAGLEAARVLALRGHTVTVFDRAPEPGGQLLMSRFVPGRSELAGLAAYLASEAARAGAELRLGIEVGADAVLAERPHVVVCATGARPGVPDIPGIAGSPAVDPFDVLRRAAGGVRRALVVGGGLLGVSVAHVLAERGVDVTISEPGDELVTELGLRPRWRFVADLRARANVTVLTRTTVEELYGDGALLRRGGEDLKLGGFDLVVPTRPMVPVRDLLETLVARRGGPLVYEIGDCLAPRTAFEAMQEAAALGHRV
ncbi:MAG: FAD-dependent oxidoreductase [Candidatus Rokubacteria bacterium]|nr:FAD-dependent oxidoreductase [Candidatus Rokubacteria bacterium]